MKCDLCGGVINEGQGYRTAHGGISYHTSYVDCTKIPFQEVILQERGVLGKVKPAPAARYRWVPRDVEEGLCSEAVIGHVAWDLTHRPHPTDVRNGLTLSDIRKSLTSSGAGSPSVPEEESPSPRSEQPAAEEQTEDAYPGEGSGIPETNELPPSVGEEPEYQTVSPNEKAPETEDTSDSTDD